MRGAGRRIEGGRRELQRVAGYVSPAMVLAATYSWEARRAAIVGGKATALPPTQGALTLNWASASAVGAPNQPAPVGELGGKPAITVTGSGRYEGTISALGDTQSFMWCGRITAANAGLIALTNAGAANTGSSLFGFGGNVVARRLSGTDASTAAATPISVVMVATLSLAGASIYMNSTTPVVSAVAATTFSQTYLTLMALNNTDTFSGGGIFGEAALWGRALSAAEINYALASAGSYYGVTIS